MNLARAGEMKNSGAGALTAMCASMAKDKFGDFLRSLQNEIYKCLYILLLILQLHLKHPLSISESAIAALSSVTQYLEHGLRTAFLKTSSIELQTSEVSTDLTALYNSVLRFDAKGKTDPFFFIFR